MSEPMQTQLPRRPKADSSFSHPIRGPRPFARSQGPQATPPIVHEVLRSPGQPLDSETCAFMEPRLGHDFEHVRVHTDLRAEESALALDASAYTVGRHLVFGPGQYAPGTGDGRRLLTHELAHVIQQQRGGTPPQLDPGAEHERAAGAAAKAIAGDGGPVAVRGATGVGIACARKDWLESTPNIQAWGYTQLLDEIDEIQQWLSNQIQSTPESVRLEEALALLQAEERRRTKSVVPLPERKKGREKDRALRSGRRQPREEVAQIAPPNLEKPRILRERTSVQYSDPEEMRREYDLIMAWLPRGDLAPDEREILQAELRNLTPSLQENRNQKTAKRREGRIQQVLTPQISGDARAMLIEQVKILDNITPHPTQPGHSCLMSRGEMIVLPNSQVQSIRQRITEAMNDAEKQIASLSQRAFDRWADQAKVNREEVFASWVVSWFEKDANEILQKMSPFRDQAEDQLRRYRAARRRGALVDMAQAIGTAEENALKAKIMVDEWIEGSISTAGKIVTVLEKTRDTAATVNTVLAAIATGGASAGVAGLIAAATPVATDVAQQASELHLGLRDRIDWRRIGVNALIGLVTSRLGGAAGARLTTLLASRLGPVGARLATNLIVGRGSAAFQTAANAVYELAQGKEMTLDQFLDLLSERLLDPKEVFCDMVMGEIGHRASTRRQRQATPAPSESPTKAPAEQVGSAHPTELEFEATPVELEFESTRYPQADVSTRRIRGLESTPERKKPRPTSESYRRRRERERRRELEEEGTVPTLEAPPHGNVGRRRVKVESEEQIAGFEPRRLGNRAWENRMRAEAKSIYHRVYPGRSGLDVHHRIPLEWSHLFHAEPNRLSNLIGLSPRRHQEVNAKWSEFRASHPDPTSADVLEFAGKLDREFQHVYHSGTQ